MFNSPNNKWQVRLSLNYTCDIDPSKSADLWRSWERFCHDPRSCLDWQTASVETTHSLRQLSSACSECGLYSTILPAESLHLEITLLSSTRLKPTNSNWVNLWPVSGSPRSIQGHWGRCLPSGTLIWTTSSWLELKAQCCRAFKQSPRQKGYNIRTYYYWDYFIWICDYFNAIKRLLIKVILCDACCM